MEDIWRKQAKIGKCSQRDTSEREEKHEWCKVRADHQEWKTDKTCAGERLQINQGT